MGLQPVSYPADHIAAIDNVTRKLMQQGQRPITTGLWFAIGHSGIIAIASVTIAFPASALSGMAVLKQIGGTVASAGFLFAIAAINLVILRAVWKTFAHVRAGGASVEDDIDLLLGGRGLLARLFRPVFGLVSRSWHMAPLGFLFGLGFDTATEVAILGLSGQQAADGMAIRKLYYNITITLISAIVAIVIGGIEALALLGGKLGLTGWPWRAAASLGEQFNTLDFAIIGVFILCWAISFDIYRWQRFDEIEIGMGGKPG